MFRRVLDVGCSLDDVEVSCASDDYTALLWEKACRHEWPVTLSAGLPASLTRPGRALVGLGAWIESDFAAAVNAMSSDPVRAREMGRIGRERAVAHFGWDAIAEQTIDVYRAALDQ